MEIERGVSTASKRDRSWNALKSAYNAAKGLAWVAPRTPSIKLGIAVVAILAGVGVALRLPLYEIALLVGAGTVVLAVETLNTSIEMLCDHLHPEPHPMIGKVKDVAAGATVITELGVAVILVLLVGPPRWPASGSNRPFDSRLPRHLPAGRPPWHPG